MDAKLYLNKAIMQLSRGLEEGGVQSLKAALESDGDVAQDAERLRDQYDDLLDDEICRADMLLDMIERFGFLAE